MTEDQAVKELLKDCKTGDNEFNHIRADSILIKFLNDNGYGKIVQTYNTINHRFWYA